MTKDNFIENYKCCGIIKIPKQEYRTIRGHELRRGRTVKKEMMLVKHNDYMGFIKLANGQHMNLTRMQLLVFEKLINDAEKGQVYVYGRDLLIFAGSCQWSLGNLFKSRKNWHEFIESTKTGFYRLKLYADEYKLKYERALQNVKKRKATGQLLNKKSERFR
jgi:hypothetical protein